MKLTKKKAIEIAIELWEWLAETGKLKGGWPDWKKYGEMDCDCPFCELVVQSIDEETYCDPCPLMSKYGGDGCYDTAFGNWSKAQTPKARKKYASQFLAQLKKLK